MMEKPISKNSKATIHFIVGMPRCGITFLSRCMNLHPEIAVFGQSRFWGRYYLPPENADGYNRKELEQLFKKLTSFSWTATVGEGSGCFEELSLSRFKKMLDEVHINLTPPVMPREVFIKISEALASLTGKQLVFEKTPHHLNWIDRISCNFPEAKFVSIKSDPYLFLLFQKNQPDLKYNPIGHSLLWKSNIISYEKANLYLQEKIVSVKTENLIQNLSFEMNTVWDFFGLDPFDPTKKMTSSNGLTARLNGKELSDIDIFWMNFLCRKHIIRYRGNIIERPFRIFKVIKSMFLLPLWMVQIGKELYSRRLGSFTKYIWKWLYLSTR